MHHVKINDRAKLIVGKIIKNKEFYKTAIHTLDNGAIILDMSKASWLGGKLVAEICMGGLGTIDFSNYKIDNFIIPLVNVYTSEPIIACMASQLAGWRVKLKKKIENNTPRIRLIWYNIVCLGGIGEYKWMDENISFVWRTEL